MTIDFRKLDRTALALQPFVDGLLTGNRTREDVPLLDLPIRWTEFGRHWEQVFEQAGGMLPRILETGAALVDQLWESRGPWCSARSYAAIEAWLRRHTLPLGAYRPRLTLKPLLFVTAVHNWWWWQRTGEQVARLYARARPAAESAEDRRERERALRRTLAGLDVANPQLLVGPTLEQQLKRDVDHFLDWLEHDEAQPQRGTLQLGDLVAMHVMAIQLDKTFSGIAPAQPGELQMRFQRLRTLDPISRLAAIGAPERPLPAPAGKGKWVGIEKLLTDPAAAGIRQSLASSLGERAVQRERRATLEVLDVFRALQALAGDVETVFGEGVRTFLIQVLHASFSDGTDEDLQRPDSREANLADRRTTESLPQEKLRQVWQCWSHHDPQRGSLAQWCGRLARWCEAKTQARRSAMPLEVEWLWRELAQRVLPHWVTGDATAVVCWGRWIRGYLEGVEESQYVPRLVLARHACRQSLEQLVSSWSIAVPRALRRAAVASGDGRTAAELQELQATLQALPAYRALVREEFHLSVGGGPPARPAEQRPSPADVAVNPGVKAYRY
jgi:hypothetical protein